jgi:hypothetical protein
MSYITVAELIAKLIERRLARNAKFGQRDDIDDFSTVSMVPNRKNEDCFSQFDYLVYHAVQSFNCLKNTRDFLLMMKVVVERSEEFKEWEQSFYGAVGTSSLSKLIEEEFEAKPLSSSEKEDINFQGTIWRILDDIEYDPKLSREIRSGGVASFEQVKEEIRELFVNRKVSVFIVRDPILIDTRKGLSPSLSGPMTAREFRDASINAGHQIEIIIIDNHGRPESLWARIPLATPGEREYDPASIFAEYET